MISFISGTIFKEKPCCKFMSKRDIKNYFRKFTKTLSICFQWNITHKIDNMSLRLTLSDKCRCQIWNSFRYVFSFHWIKFVKYMKLIQIQGTGCYDIKVTFLSSAKDSLLRFVKFESRHFSNFSCIGKKDDKVVCKMTVTFWHNNAYVVNSFISITYGNYDNYD